MASASASADAYKSRVFISVLLRGTLKSDALLVHSRFRNDGRRKSPVPLLYQLDGQTCSGGRVCKSLKDKHFRELNINDIDAVESGKGNIYSDLEKVGSFVRSCPPE